jgi:hypothetical protein
MNASEFARKRSQIERRAQGRESFRRKAMGHLVRESGAEPVMANGRLLGWRLPCGSVVCVKQRYRDAIGAENELARIRRFNSGGHIPVRVYRCEWCHGFHLTSQARNSARGNGEP